jgi:hypothetical protein
VCTPACQHSFKFKFGTTLTEWQSWRFREHGNLKSPSSWIKKMPVRLQVAVTVPESAICEL